MLKVLIVDDSLIIRRNLSKILESAGHRVIGEAKDGKEAIELYRHYKPDFVTMDITMPEMDGIMAVKEIKRLDKQAKIIMITSHGQEDMVIGAIHSGASGYLLKPIRIEKLRESIRKVFPNITDDTSAVQQQLDDEEIEEIVLPKIAGE
ncbi:MAG: response regulator [Campylobacterales bacterium]|nr:response regulator [Campylobacterales bacterium]